MNESLRRIEEIGFKKAGKWFFDKDGKLEFDLDETKKELKNVVYAYVIDKKVVYVGRTSRTLNSRVKSCHGGKKLSVKIKERLDEGVSADIYVLSSENVNKETACRFMSDILTLGNAKILESLMIEKLELVQDENAWNKQG